MPFGNNTAPGSVRAYAYGAVVRSGLPLIMAEMRERNRCWNELVAYRNERRAEKETILDDWLSVTREEQASTRERLQTLRRERAFEDADALEKSLHAARKPGYKDPAVKEQLRALEAREYPDTKAMRQAWPLWWGNYNDVLASYSQARAAERTKPWEQPRFHRFGSGNLKLYAQLMGVAADAFVEGAYVAQGPVRLAVADPLAWLHPVRGERRRRCITPLRWRVGGPKEAPVWADLDIHFHRPLPSGGVLQGAHLTCQRVADSLRWQVIFLVRQPATAASGKPGRVAVDLGWRSLHSGDLRVATWRGDDGRSGFCRIPASDLAEVAHMRELQGTRDTHRDAIRTALLGWMAQQARESLPAWIIEDAKHIWQWRSQSRFAGLYRRWKSQRFDGDTDIFAVLAAWAAQDRHLWQYWAHTTDQLVLRRRELYRRFAAQLSRDYGEVVLEEVDWSELKVRPRRGTAALRAIEDRARRNMQIASPGGLKGALKNTFVRDGGVVTMVPAPNTTRRCHLCGVVQEQLDGIELRHYCPVCDSDWDIDVNATHNLQVLGAVAVR